ncbi:MAG TPA: aminotransferase class IV [Pyrinomonadaceae bacterium]|nr:aminotransferase class IV [Pyrinomonadaceae bacterium]
MHPVIYLNKVMLEATKARVAPVSSAMLYGRGVFTTVAVHRGQPFLWTRHWARLKDHAKRLSVDLTGCNEESVGEALNKLIAVNQVKDGRARVILLARSGRDIWKTKQPRAPKTDLLIMTGEPQKIPAAGMSLAVSPYRVNTASPLMGIRSLNYLEQVLSWEEAQARDFHEAVMLNERGEIVSATMANIFWVKDGTLYTPTLATGAIAGVTRGSVITLAEKQFIPVIEGAFELADLVDAEEIFLTSASLGVALVTTFDFRQYSFATANIYGRLADALRDLISAKAS